MVKEFEIYRMGNTPVLVGKLGKLTAEEEVRVREVLEHFGWNNGMIDITDGPVLYPDRGTIEDNFVRLFDDERGIEIFEAPDGYWDWEVIEK